MKWRFALPSALTGMIAVIFLMPLSASAASAGFFGPIISGSCLCTGSAPDFGCVLLVLQNVINLAVSIGILLVVAVAAYSGLMFIVSGGSSEARTQARTLLTNAVVGIILILCSWIIVDFVMKTLYNPDVAFSGQNFGPWNQILAGNGVKCIKQNDSMQSITSGISTALNPATVTTSSGSGFTNGQAGTCTVKTSGPCASANFTYEFGDAAGQASQICSAESANGTLTQGDKIVGGPSDGSPVSFGYFQINITAHKLAASLDCPKAFDRPFTGSHKNVVIVNQSLYNDCKTMALDPEVNAHVAATIVKQDGGSWSEWSTHTQCGLSVVAMPELALSSCSIIERL